MDLDKSLGRGGGSGGRASSEAAATTRKPLRAICDGGAKSLQAIKATPLSGGQTILFRLWKWKKGRRIHKRALLQIDLNFIPSYTILGVVVQSYSLVYCYYYYIIALMWQNTL